jgi:hypothetical protein
MPNKFELVTKATGLRDRRRCFATASASSGQDPPARRRAGAREWEARAAGAQRRRSARSPFHMHTSDGFAVSSLSSIGRYAAAVVRNWGSTVLRSAGKDAGPMRWDRVAGRCDFYRAPRPCWLQLATGVLHVFHGPAQAGGRVGCWQGTACSSAKRGNIRPNRHGNFGVDVGAAFLIVALGKRPPMPYVWLPQRGRAVVLSRVWLRTFGPPCGPQEWWKCLTSRNSSVRAHSSVGRAADS